MVDTSTKRGIRPADGGVADLAIRPLWYRTTVAVIIYGNLHSMKRNSNYGLILKVIGYNASMSVASSERISRLGLSVQHEEILNLLPDAKRNEVENIIAQHGLLLKSTLLDEFLDLVYRFVTKNPSRMPSTDKIFQQAVAQSIQFADEKVLLLYLNIIIDQWKANYPNATWIPYPGSDQDIEDVQKAIDEFHIPTQGVELFFEKVREARTAGSNASIATIYWEMVAENDSEAKRPMLNAYSG